MDAILQTLIANGIPGIMLAFFIWYVNKKDDTHASERKEWKETSDEHVQKFTDVVEKNTVAITNMERTMEQARCHYSRT